MNVTFRLVRIGEFFYCNGNMYVKKSTRTAQTVGYNQRTFYFSQLENCSL